MKFLISLTTIARTAVEELRYVLQRLHLAARFVWSVVSHPIAISCYRAIGRTLYATIVFVAALLWLIKGKLDAYVEHCQQPAAEPESIDLVEVAIDIAVRVAAIAWLAAEGVVRAIESAKVKWEMASRMVAFESARMK